MAAPLRAFALASLLTLVSFVGCLHTGGSDGGIGPATGLHCPYIHGLPTPTANFTVVTGLGTIVMQICRAMVPYTAARLEALAENGTYASAGSFYRAVPGFVIQGGLQLDQPVAISEKPLPIDEYNPLLRNNGAGVVGMANAGPYSTRGDFYILLSQAVNLDDRNQVVGVVTYGMSAVHRIVNLSTDTNQSIVRPPKITQVLWENGTDPPAWGQITAYAPLPVRNGSPDHGTEWAIVLRNLGNTGEAPLVTIAGPSGWQSTIVGPTTPLPIPPGSGTIVFARVLPPANASGNYTFRVNVTSSVNASSKVSVPLTLRVRPTAAAVQPGERVLVDFVGLLADGRLFDTSYLSVAENDSIVKLYSPIANRNAPPNGQGGEYPGYPNGYPQGFQPFFGTRPDKGYAPFNFTVGSTQVIPGFSSMAEQSFVGETHTDFVPYTQAYYRTDPYQNPITGKNLVFEITVDKICSVTNSTAPCT